LALLLLVDGPFGGEKRKKKLNYAVISNIIYSKVLCLSGRFVLRTHKQLPFSPYAYDGEGRCLSPLTAVLGKSFRSFAPSVLAAAFISLNQLLAVQR